MAFTPPPTMSPPPPAPPPDLDEIQRKADQQARQLADLKEATSRFLRRDARLGQLREKTLLLRSRAKFEWKNCHDYRTFVRESSEAFNSEAAACMAEAAVEDHDERLSKLRKLQEQVIRDFEAQNEYAERSNTLQTELSEVEYELQAKEFSVKDAADNIKRILNDLVLPGNSSAATIIETELPPSTTSQISEELDPLIDNYFQKAGVVSDLVNQSIELQVNYTEARAEREFQIERGDTLELPHEVFEIIWQSRLEELAQQLSNARRVAETAKTVCFDNRLDPDKHRKRQQNESDRSVSESQPDEISRVLPPPKIQIVGDGEHAEEQTFSDDGVSGYPALTVGEYHNGQNKAQSPAPLKDRVFDWMQTLDVQHAPASGTIRPDALPRRSLSVSSPPRQSSVPQYRSPVSGPKAPPWKEAVGGRWDGQQADSAELQRRRSSDSNMRDVGPQYDSDPPEFVKGLRRWKM